MTADIKTLDPLQIIDINTIVRNTWAFCGNWHSAVRDYCADQGINYEENKWFIDMLAFDVLERCRDQQEMEREDLDNPGREREQSDYTSGPFESYN